MLLNFLEQEKPLQSVCIIVTAACMRRSLSLVSCWNILVAIHLRTRDWSATIVRTQRLHLAIASRLLHAAWMRIVDATRFSPSRILSFLVAMRQRTTAWHLMTPEDGRIHGSYIKWKTGPLKHKRVMSHTSCSASVFFLANKSPPRFCNFRNRRPFRSLETEHVGLDFFEAWFLPWSLNQCGTSCKKEHTNPLLFSSHHINSLHSTKSTNHTLTDDDIFKAKHEWWYSSQWLMQNILRNKNSPIRALK